MIAIAFAFLALLAAQPPEELDAVGEVTVTARAGRKPPRVDAIGYFRRHCYDPLRQTRYAAPPEHDLDWELLGEADRARFGISDPAVPAFALAADARGAMLLLKAERIVQPRGRVELRCTLAVSDGEAEPLVAGVSRLLGPPTQRHVGARDGGPKLDGWEQWLWTATPRRGSKSWVGTNAEGRPKSTWTVVADETLFYRTSEHVSVDLKTRRGPGRPLSLLTLSVVGAAAAMPATITPPPAAASR